MKKNTISCIPINVAVLLCIFFVQIQCGGKESPKIITRIIFITGNVELTRPGSGTVFPQIGDLLQENDSIKTLDKSSLAFQTGDRCITRIDQNSDVELGKLFSGNEAVILLNKGDMAAKVSTLRKGEGYSVKTPTIVASVRGTEFSVTTLMKEEKIAVNKGSVSVGLINDTQNNPVNDVLVEKGNTAVVKPTGEKFAPANSRIEIRPINNVEAIMIEKVELTDMVPDLNNIKTEDLKKLQGDMTRETEELNKKIEQENLPKDKIRSAKIENLIKKKTKTIEEIKEVFERIDEISLYSGQVINGAILTRGDNYSVLTTGGVINIPKDDVRAVKIIK